MLNFDPNRAITEITAKINSVLNQLPDGVQQPTMTVKVGQSLDALIIGFASDVLAPNQITDYLVRNVQPAVAGGRRACRPRNCSAGRTSRCAPGSIRTKLAAYGLTATDVSAALAANNVIAGIGNTKGQMVQVNLTASTNLHSLEEFRNLVIKQVNGGIIRLGDVAQRDAGLGRLRNRGVVRRQEGRLYRHPDRAVGQPAERDRGGEDGAAGDPAAACRPG